MNLQLWFFFRSSLHLRLCNCTEPPTSILDVGCGTGQATFTLGNFAPVVVGTDSSEGQVKEAIVQAEKRGSNVRFVKGGAEDLATSGLAAGSVDLITSAQCAHWFNLPVFYEECHKMLSPHGTLAIWCYTRPTIANAPSVESALDHVRFTSSTTFHFI